MLANSLPNAKLIVFTRHGTMARYVSNMRPEHAPIFAFTPTEEIQRQLALCWGVHAVLLPFTKDPNTTIEAAEQYLRENELACMNDNLVILSDLRAGDTQIDSIQVRIAKGNEPMTTSKPLIAQESMMD
jgi:pyruvate kinase